MYKQLNLEQRYQIAAYKKAGYGVNQTARLLDVSPATVSRELSRNQLWGAYVASYAQLLTTKRKTGRVGKRKFTSSMRELVAQKLLLRWSPEQIVGRCKLEGKPMVSVERIYQYIWEDKANGGKLYTYLRHGHKRCRKRYGIKRSGRFITGKVSIEKRPAIVAQKTREGDWEIDTIIGSQQKGAILTSVERKTQFCLMAKLNSKDHLLLQKALINMFAPYKDQVLTITSDNGLEFAGHQYIAKKLKADYYFAHPYSYWERGLNEYQNKLIRQYIPKGSNFNNYTYLQIIDIQKQLNQRPRKKLQFRTPNEVFLKYSVALTG